MSQAVASTNGHSNVTAINSSSNSNSVYVATTSVATIAPCPNSQQQFSPAESSVTAQYSQLTSYAESFQQPKIKLLTRPQPTSGTSSSEGLNHQMTNVDQMASSASNVVTGVSSSGVLPVMAPVLSGGEENSEWQTSLTLVMPSERCDDENPSVNLQEFLFNTMRSPQDNRDRVFLLQLESMFTNYINDPMQTSPLTLPPDTSYHRMLAHRVAAYFGLKHSVDPTGNSVVVWKIAESKVPDQKFEDYIPIEEKDSLEPKKQILKRSKDLAAAVASSQNLEQVVGITNAERKSMEEKEEAYEKAKARIFNQEPNASQQRNDSTPMLLPDAVVENNAGGNSTEYGVDIGKFPPEGGEDTSPGSRSRSSSQGSNISSSRTTTPGRNRNNNRRPQQGKYTQRQTGYLPTGYMPGFTAQPVAPGMLPSIYYPQQQQQQQAAMFQHYNSAAAAAAGYHPQYLQYAPNPFLPTSFYSQPNINPYAYQPAQQQLYAMPGGHVFGMLPNPAMKPAMYVQPPQQQGSFHHPHLQSTAAATTGIIRPVPQHAQPQATTTRFVSKPAHGPWKPTLSSQQQQTVATGSQLRTGNNTSASTDYQLASYMESNLTINDEVRQETVPLEQQQSTNSAAAQRLTQQPSTQYVVPHEQEVQNPPTTVQESVAAIKFFPHMTSSGQVQYIVTASPMVNSHGYQTQLSGAVVSAANPYSYQLQNAPSTPPINMINPSQPVLFSPPSSGPPTPSHYIPQGLFSPPPQPTILVGMGTQQNQQLSNLVTQQNSAEALTQMQQPEENSSVSGDRNGGIAVVTSTQELQAADATAKMMVSTGNTEVSQKLQTSNSQQQPVMSTNTTVPLSKQKELGANNAYVTTELPPRFQQRGAGSSTRYQNQRHPSNRQNTKQVVMDATNVAMPANHYGSLPTNAVQKREPLLPTPAVAACIIAHEPIPSSGQEITVLEILNFPAEGARCQAALVELKKLKAAVLNIKAVNGAPIFAAKFESVHQAQLAMQQTKQQQQPYQLVIPSGPHSKIIYQALSRRQQSTNRTS